MKTKNAAFKKILSVFLAVVIVLGVIPMFGVSVAAAADFSKIADPATVNDWKAFFGPNAKDTTWAGGVWSDKSVFTDVQSYLNATDENEGANFPLTLSDEGNFLVALSVIASSKTVKGYSTLPTDTILVLDLSGSMDVSSGTDPYVTMVNSANSAIETLLELNANNRVGVIAYSGNTSFGSSSANTATVILPLGRWEKGIGSNNQRAYLVSSWRQNNSNRNGVKVASGVTGSVAEGVKASFSESNNKQVSGGTYTQNGIYKAYQMFSEVAHITVQEGIQAGVKRKPVMVLMSDGCPTVATTNYSAVDTSNSGNGNESTYGSNGVAFMTQLTAAWARDKIEEKYNAEPLVYTLGLNVGNKAPALSLLDPMNNTSTDSFWNTFKALADKNNKNMSVNISTSATENKTIAYTSPVNETRGWSENYVTQYFGANSTAQLNDAFEDIVEQIVMQSLYYPTLVSDGGSINHDGFLEFDDYIGKNMEVKAVKGIQLGDTLYDGSTLAKMIYSGGMGTVESPTEVGNNMVWAVKTRMGITDTATARKLIEEAYSNGQLYYHIDENDGTVKYSNYIGWYADGYGKYVGFWDGKDASPEAVPADLKNKAVYANKSYGYYDAVGEGHRKTDMMYATILVSTALKDTAEGKTDASKIGDTRVIGRIPAALIPLVEYNITLNGTDTMDPVSMTISGAAAPSRLLYEVGLDSKIDLLDIEGTAPDALEKDENGNYVFYTNQWQNNEASGYEYSYSTNKNTVSFFEPSKENERYYYNIDSDIFIDTNGTLYKGNEAPTYSATIPYYHRNLIYKVIGNEVIAEWVYEKISEHVLSHTGDIAKRADNTWYITAGTIHHYYGDYVRVKDENSTGTLAYSDMPFVHDPVAGVNHNDYHVDSFLGNNGKLVITPFEGIKVSKISDVTVADKAMEFTFNVSGDVNANVTLIKEDAFGNRNESAVLFNGNLSVSIKHGESFYLIGEELTGKTLTVTEDTAGKEYKVYSVNGDTEKDNAVITVVDGVISEAEFVNTIPQEGDVVIHKTVISDIDGHFDDDFSFEITLEGVANGKAYNLLFSDGTTDSITDTKVVTLKHGESVAINDLEENVTVKVREINIPAGFTVDNAEQEVVVEAGELHYIAFTNTYSASPSDPADIDIIINKNLLDSSGAKADWNGSFTFKVQKWNGSEYVDMGSEATVNYSKNGENTVNVDLLKNQVYDKVGDYYYRIIEEVDSANIASGIVYDTTYGRFVVRVSDDGLGKLYVSEVEAISEVQVSGKTVTATFNNTYEVNGAAEVIIDINKTVVNAHGQNANLLPAGYSFSLYPADDNFNVIGAAVAVSPETAAAGTARISLLYDDISLVGTHKYVLKENAGNIEGVTYTDKEYYVEVIVLQENGYYGISVKLTDEEGNLVKEASANASAGNIVAVAEIDGADFENTFTPSEVVLTPDLTAGKFLVGRDMADKEFSFGLFEADASFKEGAKLKEATADENGFVSFGKISYTTEGERYYVVREIIPAEAENNKYNGVTYDTKVYHISVSVTGDNVTGKLNCVYHITLENENVDIITFNNTYESEPVDVVINGNKHLAGGIRRLQANAFAFELLENGVVIDTVYNGVPTDSHNAPFNFNLYYNEPGVYNYTVREKRPANIDADGKLNGIVYDLNEYSVVVTVTDNGFGKLIADVDTNANSIEFTNEYKVAPVSVALNAKKVLIGDAVSKYVDDKAFAFEIYSVKYENGVWTEDRLIETKYNNADGVVNFSVITYDTLGGYRYIIKEAVPADADPLMIYDRGYYLVEIDVTDDLHGNLIEETIITRIDDEGQHASEEIIFTNDYKAAAVSAPISGKKSYNKELSDGMFTFLLYQALPDGEGNVSAVGEAIFEASNIGDTFTFADEDGSTYLTFDRAGTYYFVVKEKLPEGVDAEGKKDGISYDTKEHVVTVTVTEGIDVTGRKILTASVETEQNGLSIINEYTTSDASVSISGNKELIGRTLKENEFTFILYDKDGKEVATAKNGADGKFSFGIVNFDKAGEYTYTVKEDRSKTEEGMIYDNREYTVKITVTDDNKGSLNAKVQYSVGEKSADSIEFVNEYSVPEAPQTGDENNNTLWFILGGGAMVLLAVLIILNKKKR